MLGEKNDKYTISKKIGDRNEKGNTSKATRIRKVLLARRYKSTRMNNEPPIRRC